MRRSSLGLAIRKMIWARDTLADGGLVRDFTEKKKKARRYRRLNTILKNIPQSGEDDDDKVDLQSSEDRLAHGPTVKRVTDA